YHIPPLPVLLFFFFYSSLHHLDLHSFPTRRSSDLHPLPGDDRIHERHRAHHLLEPDPRSARSRDAVGALRVFAEVGRLCPRVRRSEEHTSELQSRFDLVCRLLLEKKKKNIKYLNNY